MVDEDNLMACGFSSYVNINTGQTFDKRANSDIYDEIQDEETSAEKRYIQRHMKDNGGVE